MASRLAVTLEWMCTGGGGAGPAAGPEFMAALMGAGLRSRSWQANAARMQLAQNTERDGIDFERNRRFTLWCAGVWLLTAACSTFRRCSVSIAQARPAPAAHL